MAQSSWPFENIDTTETQFSQWARNIGEGVIAGKGLELEPFADSTGMTVKVKSGQALVRGHYYSSSAEETLTVPTANPTNPRIDLIVARLDPTANSIVLALVAGTPSGSPAAPAPTQTDSEIYELPIAEVYVGAAVVTIIAGNVTDLRSMFEPGAAGVAIAFSDTAPEDTDVIWYNTENGNAYFYYDSSWVSISGPSLPSGGTTAQVLAKTSSADYATEWVAPSALTLIRSATLTGVSSLSLGSNADPIFSSAYDNYRVLISSNNSTDAARSWTIRMRANTTDESGSVYNQMATGIDRAGAAQNNVTTNGTLGAVHNNCNLGAFRAYTSFDLSSPFLAQETNLVGSNTGINATNTVHQTFGVLVATNTSYNGLTISNSSGNFLDGTIEIYGYRKA
jgi:hypothetical protein